MGDQFNAENLDGTDPTNQRGFEMNHVEKLGRLICWEEFTVKPEGKTMAAYWRGVHPDKKAEYMADARWLFWASKHPAIERFLKDYF